MHGMELSITDGCESLIFSQWGSITWQLKARWTKQSGRWEYVYWEFICLIGKRTQCPVRCTVVSLMRLDSQRFLTTSSGGKFFQTTLWDRVEICPVKDVFAPQKQQDVACEQLQWKASTIFLFSLFLPTCTWSNWRHLEKPVGAK